MKEEEKKKEKPASVRKAVHFFPAPQKRFPFFKRWNDEGRGRRRDKLEPPPLSNLRRFFFFPPRFYADFADCLVRWPPPPEGGRGERPPPFHAWCFQPRIGSLSLFLSRRHGWWMPEQERREGRKALALLFGFFSAAD